MTFALACSLLTAAVVGQAGAANAPRASVLTSWRPGQLFHLGVTTPDKTKTTCLLAVSLQGPATPTMLLGCPLVVDLAQAVFVPLAAQANANPSQDHSTDYKWSLNYLGNYGGLPVGTSLHLQAFLTGASGTWAITNGIVGQIQPPAAPERRFTVGSFAANQFSFHEVNVDVNALTPLYTHVALNTYGGGSFFRGSPQVSEDGRFAVTSISNGSSSGAFQDETLVLDLSTSPPTPHVFVAPPGADRGLVRFRPGENDRVWLLEVFPDNTCYLDRDADLVALNLFPPFNELARIPVERDVSFCRAPQGGWSFDGNGSRVVFLSVVKPGPGAWGPVYAETVDLGSPASPVVATQLIANGRDSWLHAPTGVPGGSAVLVGVWDSTTGRHGLFSVMTPTGATTASAPLWNRKTGAFAESGASGIVQSTSPDPYGFIDGVAPSLTVLSTGNLPHGGNAWPYTTFATVHGDLLVAGAEGTLNPIHRLACTASGATVLDNIAANAEPAFGGWFYINLVENHDPGVRYGGGNYAPLAGRDGLLVTLSGGKRVLLLDVGTMTFGLPSLELPNGAPSVKYIF